MISWPALRDLRRSAAPVHQFLRYVVAGATVTVAYIAMTLMLSGAVGIDIQIAIPISWALATALHFALQRWFVFGHAGEFALPLSKQVARYVPMGVCQYTFTAAATAVLPGVVGVAEQAVYVAAALVAAAAAFVFLRLGVFRPRSGSVTNDGSA